MTKRTHPVAKRLLANFTENDLDKLSKILASENNGKINYLPFLIHVRTVCSTILQNNETEDSYNEFNYQFGKSGHKDNVPGIIEQLLLNCIDENGLLLPIRQYLLNNITNNNWIPHNIADNNSNIYEITVKEFTNLLEEFSVMFSAEDVITIITEIGLFPSNKNHTIKTQKKGNYYEDDYGNSNSYHNLSTKKNTRNITSDQISESENRNIGELAQFNGKSIDARLLLSKLMQSRPPWPVLHPKLAARMKAKMRNSGTDTFSLKGKRGANAGSGTGDQGPSSFTGNHGKSFSYGKSLNGIETATARKLLNRLKSFTNISLNGAITNSSNNGFNKYGNDNDDDSENGENDELFHEFESDGILNGEERMVEKDVFGYISRISGMVLTDSDLTVLADCTDFNPIGERIKVDVVLECLNNYPVNNDIKKKKRDRNNNYDDNDNDENEKMKNGYYDDDNNYIAPNNPENSLNIEVLSEPALFALKHISHQIWRTADTLKRSSLEWCGDVMAVFKGFDTLNTGYITTEDFLLSLELLNSAVNISLLRDIPTLPDGPGLVCYKPIIDLILYSTVIKDNSRGLHLKTNEITLKTKASENNRKREESVLKNKYNEYDNNDKENAEMAPILSILSIVRKSLRKFITSIEDFREAKSVMLKVFRSFDPQEKNKLSTRDFCLAVSVLINEIRRNEDNGKEDKNGNILHGNSRELNTRKTGNIPGRNSVSGNVPGRNSVSGNVPRNNISSVGVGSKQKNVTISNASAKNILLNDRRQSINNNNNNNNDDNNVGNDVPILSKQDWTAIYNYFASSPPKSPQNTPNYNPNNSNTRKAFQEITVDYLKFCDSVLNYDEIKKLIYITVSGNTDSRNTVFGGEKRGSIGGNSGGHFNKEDVSTARNMVRSNVLNKNTMNNDQYITTNNNNNNNNNTNNSINNRNKYSSQTERVVSAGVGRYKK